MEHIEVPDGPELSDADMCGLQDSLTLYRATNQARSDQIDTFLAERPWYGVAVAAVSACQTKSLGLKPWIVSPVYIDLDDVKPGQEVMGRLLARMLAANVSRYSPDPMAALAAVEGRGKTLTPRSESLYAPRAKPP